MNAQMPAPIQLDPIRLSSGELLTRHIPLPNARPLPFDSTDGANGDTAMAMTAPQESTECPQAVAALSERLKITVIGDMPIPTEQIVSSPFNPRKYFDPAELRKLADSLETHGQLQNLTVRKLPANEAVDPTYELIGGERRWRAAQLAEIPTMNCRVIECDDATAVELRGIENYRREQLNPVEEGIWFSQMINTGRFNQTTLGVHLGISHSQVNSRLRLLDLPESWLDRIAKGTLPSTHARAACAWSDYPAILAHVEQQFEMADWETVSVSMFSGWLYNSVIECSRMMIGNKFVGGPSFEPTEEQRKALDLKPIPIYLGANRTADRAFNTALWDELNAAALAAETDDGDIDDDHDEDSESSAPSSSVPAKPAQEFSSLTEYQLREHFENHICSVIAGHIKPDAFAIRMFFTCVDTTFGLEPFVDWLSRQAGNDDVAVAFAWEVTTSLSPKNLVGQIAEFLKWYLCEASGALSLDVLQQAAAELKIEPLAKWVPSKELLSLCTTSQLRELFAEEMADPKKVAKWNKDRLIKEALNTWPPGYLPILLTPPELLPAKQSE